MRRRTAVRSTLLAVLLPGVAVGAQESCLLVDAAADAGIDFRHRSGISERRHLPETMGAGLAWLDYDGDGWIDLYAVQSGPFPPAGGEEAANRLFRNNGDGRFIPLPGAAAAGDRGYGQGTLAVDLEGDGDTDLVVANFGEDTIWWNRGDGSFEPALLGPAEPGPAAGWSSSLAAGDLDDDRDLDLYLARYMVYDPAEELFCGDSASGVRDYCDPNLFLGAADAIFRQVDRGVFVEESLPLPDTGVPGRGLGVIVADLGGDRRPEIYVSNDLDPNNLWVFQGGAPVDQSLFSGAGVNREGRPEAGMGLALLDGDGDGDPEIFVTNFDVETNTYYENLGGLAFEDTAAASGLGPASLNALGFGVVAADFDRDGHQDLYVANGHIFPRPSRDNVDYAQADRLFRGDGTGAFEPADCPVLDENPSVARGAAWADYDNDGDADVAVQANDGPLRLLRNEVRSGRWLGLALRAAPPERLAAGARIRALGSRRHHLWSIAGDSYQSSSSQRLLLSDPSPFGEVEIAWPSGRRVRYLRPPTERYLVLAEPSGGTAQPQ